MLELLQKIPDAVWGGSALGVGAVFTWLTMRTQKAPDLHKAVSEASAALLASLQAERDKYSSEVRALHTTINQMHQEMIARDHRIADLEAHSAVVEQKVAELTAELADMHSTLGRLTAERDDAVQKITQINGARRRRQG